METPNHTELKLSNEQKLKINAKLKKLQDYLDHISDSLNEGFSKEEFLSGYEEIYDRYVDMVSSGSTPDRAKFVLMSALKRGILEQMSEENDNRRNSGNGLEPDQESN